MSIQIARKINRSNKIIKTIGVEKTKREEELLILLDRTEIEQLQGMQRLFVEHDDFSGRKFCKWHCKQPFADCWSRINSGKSLY